MSIGESLAEARRRAGLTVAQVSQETRIREAIIRGIEQDDFSQCGGNAFVFAVEPVDRKRVTRAGGPAPRRPALRRTREAALAARRGLR